jgi:hypothetical protein
VDHHQVALVADERIKSGLVGAGRAVAFFGGFEEFDGFVDHAFALGQDN